MKKRIFTTIFFLIIISQFIFSDPQLHTREMMMQVVNSSGNPMAITVQLYKNNSFYYELYRTGTSASYWKWTNPNANVVCDINDDNTNDPTWAPIEPGSYLLKAENKYASLFIDPDWQGSIDFIIKYQNGVFSIVLGNPYVNLGSTQNWNKIVSTFKQLKSDGSTSINTVAIGQGSAFSTRYNAPFNFYINQSQNYLFHADTNVSTSQKYYNWQDITDVKNFREKNSGVSNFDVIANFNSTYSGVTLQNNWIEYQSINLNNDAIQFKDPWLIDYKDPNHGNHRRNRGMNDAVFVSRISPFYPDYSTFYGADNYKGVFLNQPIVSGQPYYSISSQPQDIYLTQSGKTHKFYFQSWTYDPNKIALQNPTSNETPVVFKTSDATVTANLKGTQLSNNVNAYANNSQRKFVRTNNGHLHNVYESIGRAWYERSTDNGVTWEIMNGGKPLDNGEGKLPSIDFKADAIGIVWQENDGGAVKIQLAYFYNGILDNDYPQNVFWDENQSYNNNLNPVIGWEYNSRIIVAWENKSADVNPVGIVSKYGSFSSFGINWFDTENISTDINAINPTIAANKSQSLDRIFYFAWQQSYSIKYCKITGDGYNQISPSAIETPSSGNGYSNSKPSIAIYWTQQYPTISWLAEHSITYQKKVQLRIRYGGIPNWSQFYIWGYGSGNSVNSANINNNSDGKFVLAWGGEASDQYITSLSTTSVYNLSTQGDVQVSNAGTTMGDMKIMSFDKISSVHDFTANTLTQGIYKGNSNEIVSKGFILTNDKDVYAFDFGAIEADGKRILFNDSFEVPDTSSENNKVETESFYLSDKSDFNFKIDYFSSVQQTNTAEVNFKLQLVEANTGEILSLLKEVNPDSIGINTSYNDLGFTVNLNGLGNKEVKLRLIFEAEDYDAEIYTETVSDSVQLNKQNYQQISYNGLEAVKDYGLSQNYPNPFNPSTIINYQIPQDGFVTLKIYDVLGKEIKTLVNENKTIGRYEINFNGSDLASGIYIYQFKVNDYISSKKMLMVK